jgi:hypothetical protein
MGENKVVVIMNCVHVRQEGSSVDDRLIAEVGAGEYSTGEYTTQYR